MTPSHVLLLTVFLSLGAWAGAPSEKDLAKAASPASPERTFKGRALEVRVDDAPALFNAADRSRFVFAGIDIPKSRSRYGVQTRTIKRGEALLVDRTNGDFVTAYSIDGQFFEVSSDDLTLEPPASAALFPLTAGDLPVRVTKPSGEAVVLTNEPVTDSGMSYAKAPALFTLLKADDPRKEKMVEAREKTVACYDAEMTKLDPQNKRARFVQETYDRKTGQTQKIESLAAALDRKVCSTCKCKDYNARQAALARELLEPQQTAALAAMKPAIDRVTSLFAR
jgi:hypothetical protein